VNFYKRYPGDYMRDTAHLSLIEHGAYTVLLDTIYATERALPKNPAGLFRVCRGFSEDEQSAILSVIDQFFVETDKGYIHPRVAEELEKATLLKTKARENGRKGGRPCKTTQTESESKPDENPAGYEEETQPVKKKKAYQTPDTRPLPNGKERGRATRLTADWMPSDEQICFCKTERPDLNPTQTADRFRDYWIAKSGKDATKLDWDATWRNWVRNERAVNGSHVVGQLSPSEQAKKNRRERMNA